MSGCVTIRPATAGDIAAVRDIVSQSWMASYGPAVGASAVTDMAAILLSEITLRQLVADASVDTPVALVDGAAAATAMARREDDCLHVQRLYVLPQFQRRGLGVALLAWLAARQRTGMTIRLEAADTNHGALRFYRREGFADIGGDREIIGGVSFVIRRLERRARG